MDDKEILSEIDRCIHMEAEAVGSLTGLQNKEALLQTVHAICDCRGKVILSGCGTSAMAAKKIRHSLNCVERPAMFLLSLIHIYAANTKRCERESRSMASESAS